MEGSEFNASVEESEEGENGTKTEEGDVVEEDGAPIEGSEVDVEMKDDALVVVDTQKRQLEERLLDLMPVREGIQRSTPGDDCGGGKFGAGI